MVDITDITTGTKNGTGYFDKFMDSINVHIEDQFQKGRITGKDYGVVYLGALQAALAQAVAYVGVQEQVSASSLRTAAEAALLAQKLITERAQVEDVIDTVAVLGSIGKQKALQEAQANGFARDAEQKALKILMDAWQVNKSVLGDALEVPDGARNDDIEEMIIKLRQGIEITESIYKFSASAGEDQEVTTGYYVELDGTGSTSPTDDTENPEIISGYLWTQLSGTSAGTITNATLERASFTAPAVSVTPSDNQLVFQLTISSSGASPDSSDTVTVTVS